MSSIKRRSRKKGREKKSKYGTRTEWLGFALIIVMITSAILAIIMITMI